MKRKIKPYPIRGQMVKGYRYTAPITFSKDGWLASGRFPAECIADCSASGAVDIAIAHWLERLDFVEAISAVRPLAVRYLREFGAWQDLGTADISVLAARILWIACCDIREHGEWSGLVH